MSQTTSQRLIDYNFNDQSLLARALTHRSHSSQHNERLEFLGDGVLNCVIAAELYRRYPRLPEGDLSRLRAHLVREQTLSEIALGLHIGESLRMGEGELKTGGHRRPSVLADAVEALIGAVFVDGGFTAAEAVVTRLYQTLLDGLDPKAAGRDPKSLLQEHLQAHKIDVPEYSVISTEGEAHCQVFHVECAIAKLKLVTQGSGNSRRIAEQQAAQRAYDIILSKP